MVRITGTPSSAVTNQHNAVAKNKAPIPHSPDDVGVGQSDLSRRRSAYDVLGVSTEVQQPPGMPSARDRDSEKIVYRDDDKHPAVFNPPAKLAHLQNKPPHSAEDIQQGIGSSKRASVYDSLGVDPHLPPGMPSARDRDSEKIAYQDYSDKHAVADNPPTTKTKNKEMPQSAEHIQQGIGSSKRASIYDSLGVDPHMPPGMPSAKDRDSEKIAYQDYSDKHAVADNPPLPLSRKKEKAFSAEHVEQGIGSSKRASVYDSLNVQPHQPPGVPSARDLDSEKIAYSDYSDKHPASFNPPAKLSRLQNTVPFSPDQISRPTASGVRSNVYDALGVDAHMPPGMPSARDRDSEKIVDDGSAMAARGNSTKKPAELDSNPLFEAPGDHGTKELPTTK